MRLPLVFLAFILLSCKPNPDFYTQEEFKGVIGETLTKGDTLAAIELFDKYSERFPDDLQAKVMNIGLKVKVGQLSENDALELIQDMDISKLGGRAAEYDEVYSTFDSIPSASAIQKVDVLIAKYPDDFYNYYSKGKKLIDLKKYHEAIELFDQVIKMQPDYRYAHADKALAQYMLGDKETACETWKTSMGGGAMYREKYCK